MAFRFGWLIAVLAAMIQRAWARTSINKGICRIKQLFWWVVENGLVPPVSYYDLCSVVGSMAYGTNGLETTFFGLAGYSGGQPIVPAEARVG